MWEIRSPDLSGLWKNQPCGVLVHLRETEIDMKDDSIGSGYRQSMHMKAKAQIVKGNFMDILSGEAGRLTSVLPKRGMIIIVTRINKTVDRKDCILWDVAGVVVLQGTARHVPDVQEMDEAEHNNER